MTLYEKLFEVQKEVGVITKDSKNPFYNSAYFDINKLVEVLKPLLIKYKLVITQPVVFAEGRNVLHTIVTDIETGDNIESAIALPENIEPQKMGSAITYLRRYSLQSMLFLQAEDDDGNNTSSQQPKVYKLTGQETRDPQYAPRKAVKAPQKPVGSDIEPF